MARVGDALAPPSPVQEPWADASAEAPPAAVADADIEIAEVPLQEPPAAADAALGKGLDMAQPSRRLQSHLQTLMTLRSRRAPMPRPRRHPTSSARLRQQPPRA